ncbi:hypothetical protein XENOCAPTIV_023288 [Xenoophorus captivus]|uniref:Uncharacterized protein n=1 Tax=Xenoophorus captivus TaxID=1517983 RepID=A0ABV0S0W3_9TELE
MAWRALPSLEQSPFSTPENYHNTIMHFKGMRLITEHDLLTGILCAFVRQPQRHHRLPVKLNPSRCSTPLERTVKGAPRR